MFLLLRIRQAFRLVLALCACIAGATAPAQTPEASATEQQRRATERAAQQRQRLEPRPEVHLQPDGHHTARRIPPEEAPCFPIDTLRLEGELHERFSWLLGHADGHLQLAPPDPVIGRCLGTQGIQIVIDRLQHALVAAGYVTSRVMAGPQNLQTGALVLTLLPGRVGAVRFTDGTGERASRWNTVPASSGEVLNLRDVEQALENFQRAPSAEVDVEIAPGQEPGTSDLLIAHRQPMPLRISATADDSGTRSTGKFQGSFTFSHDSPLNLSDLFYLTLLHEAFGEIPIAHAPVVARSGAAARGRLTGGGGAVQGLTSIVFINSGGALTSNATNGLQAR
ncbi:POTRA domain-containing protein [Ramlibacter rhizophilus]|uniref:ShlB/FhaC/HecB family hemolysin secretion/activation protein n=1 Tax=Ramlibacter rhizophilus TaxID=1781167 RepID=A0A4Z0BSR3_9BURK|nr:POTRA domain-containing protein [Ramlibacter rhizophilus]TFZ01039.1 ShlB/FhaC/HecB family hemolysin secretion/activation protein [Ramlibacter rhizophilus]